MKLTKRQLKRIIREEYSRLKRRGLIRENTEQREVEDGIFEMACDAIDDVLERIGYQEVPHREFMRACQESSYPQCWESSHFVVGDIVKLALQEYAPGEGLRTSQLIGPIKDRLEVEYAKYSDPVEHPETYVGLSFIESPNYY